MANSIIHGNSLMLFVGGDALAYATSHTFSMNLETNQISTKDHGESPATIGQSVTWEITTENLYTTQDANKLRDAMISKQDVIVVFGRPTGYDTKGTDESISEGGKGLEGVGAGNISTWAPNASDMFAAGRAKITSLSINANAGENATYSATLQGSGAFSTKTIPTDSTQGQ